MLPEGLPGTGQRGGTVAGPHRKGGDPRGLEGAAENTCLAPQPPQQRACQDVVTPWPVAPWAKVRGLRQQSGLREPPRPCAGLVAGAGCLSEQPNQKGPENCSAAASGREACSGGGGSRGSGAPGGLSGLPAEPRSGQDTHEPPCLLLLLPFRAWVAAQGGPWS